MFIELLAGILVVASIFVNTAVSLQLLRERNEDREKSTQAIRRQYLAFTRAKEELIERAEQEYLRGKQSGRREILSLIKKKVDSGEMKVTMKK